MKPAAAGKGVIARATEYAVSIQTAVEHVASIATDKQIVAIPPFDRVVARAAVQGVGVVAPHERVVAGGSLRGWRIAVADDRYVGGAEIRLAGKPRDEPLGCDPVAIGVVVDLSKVIQHAIIRVLRSESHRW